jgi:hypothetical protein
MCSDLVAIEVVVSLVSYAALDVVNVAAVTVVIALIENTKFVFFLL